MATVNKEYLEDFDKEILSQISKKQAIEAMSGLYNHLPQALIEQFYDFCNDPKYKDYNEYLYLQSRYGDLNANELKRYYKLHNKMINQFQNIPTHQTYKKDQIIEDSIRVVENIPREPPKMEFIPKQEFQFFDTNEEILVNEPLITGRLY